MDTHSPSTKGERTRQRILQEAVKSIAANGFEGLVLSDIASRAGISRAGLLQHFESKEFLIAETSRYLTSHGRDVTVAAMAMLAAEPDPIIRYIRATFEWGRQFRDEVVLLVYLMNRSGYDVNSSRVVNDIFGFAYQRIALLLAHQASHANQASSDLPRAPDLGSDVQILQWQQGARIIHSILLGFIVRIPVQDISAQQMTQLETECLVGVRAVIKALT